MKQTFYIIGSILTLTLFASCSSQEPSNSQSSTNTQTASPPPVIKQEVKSQITFEEQSYDFGVIKQSGGKVKHDFVFTYTGETPIKITGVPTSCACTSAKIDKTNLSPGESGTITVVFNPNLHEEPAGKFFKSISLLTEPSLEEMPEIKIWAEIDLDLGPDAYELKQDHEDEEGEEDGLTSYTSITPEKFSEMMKNKDFILIDTHIPKQEHIEATDVFIPYNEIDHHPKLPTDKSAKIVLYCRSGSMSRAAAYQLAEEGYTNVYDLVGGKNAYDEFLKKQKSTSKAIPELRSWNKITSDKFAHIYVRYVYKNAKHSRLR